MARLRITLTRSPIGRHRNQRRTLTSLGLRKLNQSRDFQDTPDIRGKVFTVQHLVTVEEIKE